MNWKTERRPGHAHGIDSISGLRAALESGGGVEEAPSDGTQYGRQSNTWTPVIPGGGDGRTLIETITDPISGEFDFALIPGNYQNLLLEGEFRSSAAVDSDGTRVYVNADTVDPTYTYQANRARDGSSITPSSAGQSSFGNIPGAASPANSYSSTTMQIQNYTSSRLKIINVYSANYLDFARIDIGTTAIVHETITAPITRIRIRTDNFPGDDLLGTARLYGITDGVGSSLLARVEALENVALTPLAKVWAEEVAELVENAEVITTDNAWTEIYRTPIAPGTKVDLSAEIKADRESPDGNYRMQVVTTAMEVGVTLVDSEEQFSLGNTQLQVRVISDPDIVYQVRGRAGQTWNWKLIVLFLERE